MRKKIFFSLFMFLLVLNTANVFAMTPTYSSGARFTRGVGNTCYYVDSTANRYLTQINAAADNWVDTGYGWNPIYMTPVSSNYATHMDFYGRTQNNNNVINNGVTAYVSFWTIESANIQNNREMNPSTNYYYTEINFNLEREQSDDSRVALHEIGHAFGLAHSSSNASIMNWNLPVYRVGREDHDTINYLYN